MNNSFILILNSRYPTEKAYGVTTTKTFEALQSQGNFVEIWAPGIGVNGTPSNLARNLVSKRFEWLLRLVGKFSERFSFNLQLVICLTSVLKFSRGRREIVFWVRDPYMALGLLFLTSKKPIIFEMHFPMKKFVKTIMLNGVRRKRVLIGALTESHLMSLDSGDGLPGTFLLPMAAPDTFFEVGIQRPETIKAIPVIGYIGKAASSGNENGLNDLLKGIKLAQDRGMKVQFWLAGIEAPYLSHLRQSAKEAGICDTFLKITGHVDHLQVPEILSRFDVGLVPYRESTYNSYRFPIKLVEYAAAKLPILATGTVSHLQILNPSIAVFYDQSEPLDFVLKIENLLKHPTRILELKERAADWASNYTYYNRVKLASETIANLGKMG